MELANVTDLITSKLTRWLEALIKLLPNIAMAAVVMVIGFYTAKFIRRITVKIISQASSNVTLNSLFSSIVYFIVIGIVIFTVLTILNLDKAVTSILAGAGVLGLALAFAFQDIASNFMSGIFMSFRKLTLIFEPCSTSSTGPGIEPLYASIFCLTPLISPFIKLALRS